jgi:hypothetical protein
LEIALRLGYLKSINPEKEQLNRLRLMLVRLIQAIRKKIAANP